MLVKLIIINGKEVWSRLRSSRSEPISSYHRVGGHDAVYFQFAFYILLGNYVIDGSRETPDTRLLEVRQDNSMAKRSLRI